MRVNDFSELQELDLVSDDEPTFYMRIDRYDERSGRAHVKRVKEILGRPTVLTAATEAFATIG